MMEFSSCLSLEFAHIHSHSPPLVFLPPGGPLPSSTWSSFRFHGLYVNMSMCIYVHICIYNTYVLTRICLCTCVYVYMCICIHTCMYACKHIISVYVSHMNEMCSFPSSCRHLFLPPPFRSLSHLHHPSFPFSPQVSMQSSAAGFHM